MNVPREIAEKMGREAGHISSHSEFSYEDALGALKRCFRYYTDCGEDDANEAWEKAREMVAEAVYTAQKYDFDLTGMVNQIIFSFFHRVQPGCGI